LTLLIVDRNHQGKGIGKDLLKGFVDHLKKREGKRFDLFTDTESSFGFYDKKRLMKAGMKHVMVDLYTGDIRSDQRKHQTYER